ncbi:MAG TPA: SRPBCC domain-containing protein, partial [Promineifilum sp.]|nr:SRPBCC domain-containing protein [Promineifilum sp.]
MSKPEIIVEPGSQEIVTKMTFNAPRALIFKAYTDPDLIPQWYGPRYLTTVVDVLDARAGGSWRFLNYDPEGNVYAFHGVYHDVVAPER